MNKTNISARNTDFRKRHFCDVTNVGALSNRDLKIMSFSYCDNYFSVSSKNMAAEAWKMFVFGFQNYSCH